MAIPLIDSTVHIVEWSHGDGMDQHLFAAYLTLEQKMQLYELFDARGAIDVAVWEPQPAAFLFEELLAEIDQDLPEDEA